jgi:uncharacterized protein
MAESQEQIIRRVLKSQRIAVVGASDRDGRPANYVPAAVQSAGKTILPVNPKHEQVLGERCYATLAEVPGPIDLVNVFRRSEFCAQVVREAIEAGARAVWLQSGIISSDARRLAEQAGIDYIEDKCLMIELQRHG